MLTRLTATVTISAPEASIAFFVSSKSLYLPVPTMRREQYVLSPNLNASFIRASHPPPTKWTMSTASPSCKNVSPCALRATMSRLSSTRSEENTTELQSRGLIPFAVFFFNDTATTEIYTLSLHDALPILDDLDGVSFLYKCFPVRAARDDVAVELDHDPPAADAERVEKLRDAEPAFNLFFLAVDLDQHEIKNRIRLGIRSGQGIR